MFAEEAGGCRGEELFDALLEVGVLAGGALGARLRLVELRLLWMDRASNLAAAVASMLLELRCWYCECELGGFFVSRRREDEDGAAVEVEVETGCLVLFWFKPSMIQQRNVGRRLRGERGRNSGKKAKRKSS